MVMNIDSDENGGSSESPVKILVNLYSVIAGLASVTAVKFIVNPHEGVIRSPFSIPVIDLLSFLTFFSYIIPFYHGAITYLHNEYSKDWHGKKGEILMDYLHLLAESMIFFAISSSLSNIMLFLSWLSMLIIVDTVWLSTIVLRKKKTVVRLWIILNLYTFILIIALWVYSTPYPDIINGVEGHTILFFFSIVRTILDYVYSKSFYFK